jgi:hypothetical protein
VRIYYSAVQPTRYQLQRQPYAGGAWASDTTQPSAGVVLVSALTYNGTTPGVSLATNDGWTLLTDGSYWYRILPTYADGSTGDASLPILPRAQSAYECVVSGVLPTSWATGTHLGAAVTGKLSAFVTAGGQEYPRPLDAAAINATTGAWSMVCPRGVTVEFTLPSGDRPNRVIPDASSASFESLAPG